MLYFFTLILIFFSGHLATAGSVQIQLDVAACNSNAICESVIGENYGSCPSDCSATDGRGTLFTSVEDQQSATTSLKEFNDFFSSKVTLVPSVNSALISFGTLYPALATVSWGKTPQYEAGSLAQSWYHNIFSVTVDKLDPSTLYYYHIPLVDSRGKRFNIEGEFRTLPIPDTTSPSAPSGFSNVVDKERVIFRWNNPSAVDFAFVRLVRSTIFYPKDLLDGKVVYEGSGQYAADDSVRDGQFYYYSIFAIDSAGNASGPAILHVLYKKPQSKNNIPEKIDPLLKDDLPYMFNTINSMQNLGRLGGFSGGAGDEEVAFVDKQNQPFCVSRFSLTPEIGNRISTPELVRDNSTIKFYQEGSLVKPSFEGQVIIDNSKPVSVVVNGIDQNLYKENILGFCVAGTLTDQRFGFILTKNKNTDLYEVTIPSFYEGRQYEFYISSRSDGQKEIVLARGIFVSENKSNKQDERGFFGKAKVITGIIVGSSVKIMTGLVRFAEIVLNMASGLLGNIFRK